MKDVLKYIEECTTPKERRFKQKNTLCEIYSPLIKKMLTPFEYRNKFIEDLVKYWAIESPMMIYSPWVSKAKQTGDIIAEWVYKNRNGHIFYDPKIYYEWFDNIDNLDIGIQLPDMLVYAMLSETYEQFLLIVREFLLHQQHEWNYSEQNSITESDD